jgi:hypothetical protein
MGMVLLLLVLFQFLGINMAYGISLQSDSGFTLIDQDYENYALYTSGSVSATNFGSTALPFDFTTDFILVRSDTYNVAIGIYSMPTTSSIVISVNSTTAITVEYIILRKMSLLPLSSETYGFEVYKSNGVMAYSTRAIVPSIQNTLSLTAAQAVSATSFNLTIPSPVLAGKKRYFNLLPAKVNKVIPAGPVGQVTFQGRSGKFVNDNTFTTDFRDIVTIPVGSSFTASWPNPISFIILDI